jgi:ureidoacrylate peracid hydrolase
MTAVLATLEQQARPDRAALLVIDMQNDFCADGGFLHKERGYNVEFANAVVDNIADAIAYARAPLACRWCGCVRSTISNISPARIS